MEDRTPDASEGLPASPNFVPYNPYAVAAPPPAAVAAAVAQPLAQERAIPYNYGAAGGLLRPLLVSEILDRSFALYRRHASRFLAILGLAYVPYIIINTFLIQWFTSWSLNTGLNDPQFTRSPEFINSLGRIYAGLGLYFGLSLLLGVLLQIATAALIKSAAESYLGQPLTLRETYRYTFGRLGSLLGWLALVSLALAAAGLGVLCLFAGPVAAFFLAPFYLVSLQVLVIERLGPLSALNRSRALIKNGAWGRSIGLWLLTILLSVLLNGGVRQLVNTLLQILLPTLDLNLTTAIGTVVSGVTSFLLEPVSVIAFTLFYLDLRVRQEGLDFDIALDRLRREQATPAAKAELGRV